MTLNRHMQPPVNAIGNINWLPYQTLQLNNGSPVWLMPGEKNELIKIEWVFEAGNKFQPKPLSGSFTSTLLKEGTRSMDSKTFNEHIDFYGAFLSVESDRDFVSVKLYTLIKHLDDLLPMVSEMIAAPAFPADILDVKTRNAQQQFVVDMDKVAYRSRRELTQQVMGRNHYYGAMAGYDDYESLSADDVRSFHGQHFFCSPPQIFIAGHVPAHIEKQLNQHFGHIGFTTDRNFERKSVETQSGITRLKMENTLQSAIRYGKLAPMANHPDAVAFDVAVMILGGFFGSRLMKNLREEKGFTYGVHAAVLPLQEVSMMTIGTELGNEHVNEAVDEINKELRLLANAQPEKEELTTVKNYMAGQLVKEADGAMSQSDLLRFRVVHGLSDDYHQTILEQLHDVQPENIAQMAHHYFQPETFSVVIAG